MERCAHTEKQRTEYMGPDRHMKHPTYQRQAWNARIGCFHKVMLTARNHKRLKVESKAVKNNYPILHGRNSDSLYRESQ